MPKITEKTKVENGMVIGYVRTDKVGSTCTFAICPVDEWEEMDDKEAEQCALDALYESGMMEWGY